MHQTPRYCYKYNRAQKSIYTQQKVDFEQSQKSSRQFYTLNPFQSFPNFNAHLADCLLNPVKNENLSTSKEHQRHLQMQLTLAKRQV